MSAAPELSIAQARALRVAGQGLLAPCADPLAAARAIGGAQAQILPAAGIALWNRAPGLTAAGLSDLLYRDRALIKTWGQRGTLHLYPAADWPLIYAAQADLPTYWERKAAREGLDMAAHERLVAQAAALLAGSPTLGRSDLRASGLDFDDQHLSGWGGIFAVLVRRGLACHAEPAGGEARMAHRARWLPDLAWAPPSPAAANVELARRYLAAYGPAELADLAYWRGRAMADARRWLAALGDEVAAVRVAGRPALMLRADLARLADLPPPEALPPRLLGRFDPLLLGHRDKGWLVAPAHYGRVWRPAGHIEATMLVAGAIAGTWRYDWRGDGVALTMRPLRRLPAATRRALERAAAGLAGHLGAPLAELAWEIADG